jgi:hypothetical protein
MRSTHTFTIASLAFLLLAGCILTVQSVSARTVRRPPKARVQSSCADQPNDCKLPTRYLGEKDGCACFACEFGKKTQLVICTKDKRDRNLLMLKVRQRTSKKAATKVK